MKINPYLMFNGRCQEAFKFYEQALGAKVPLMMTYRGSPAEKETAPEWQDKILHARLEIGDQVIMASDAPPGRYEEPKGISVSLNVEKAAEAERIFKALSEKADIGMPIEETFWAERFGMLTDQFGIPWMINCEKKNY